MAGLILVFDLDYTGVNFGRCSDHECLAFAASFVKGHYPKLYNMAHLFSLNVFTASKGSNNYTLGVKLKWALYIYIVFVSIHSSDRNYIL